MKNEKSPPLFVGAGAVEWTWRGIQARHEHVKNSAPYDILMRVLFSLFICGRLQVVLEVSSLGALGRLGR